MIGKRRIDLILGLVLALLAFTVYCFTLSDGAFPGRSAQSLLQYTGLFPVFSPSSPIWAGMVRLLSQPFVGCVFRINLFSALCGALSVWLLYEIVSKTIFATIDVDESGETNALTAARLAGISSALALAFCMPFWFVSNRADIASFDTLLLLIVTWVFSLYARTGKYKYALLFAFLYGIGIVELATFIVLAPLFGGYLVFLLWREEKLRTPVIVQLVLCAVSGLLLYLVSAWLFYGTEGYHLRNYSGYFQVVWFTWRDQYFLITRGLPKEGWLIVLVVSVVPWLTGLMVARRALNGEKDTAYYVLHAILTGLAVCLLLNLKFAPWTMLGTGKLLVTPYVLNAMVFGYAVAYWFLLPRMLWRHAESNAASWARHNVGRLFAAVGLIFLCVVSFRNLPQADARAAGMVNRYAEAVIDNVPDNCSWLIADGIWDNHFMITARGKGRDLKILNIRGGASEVYMKWVATLFDEVRLKNLARIGMIPMLNEWFGSDPDVQNKVAVLSSPDLWISSGFTVVPHKLVFVGVQGIKNINAEKLYTEQEQFWAEFAPVLQDANDGAERVSNFGREVVRHASMVANNLGVLMEDLAETGIGAEKVERQGHAFASYRKAREINPENISALLNMANMVENGYPAPDTEAIKKDLEELGSNMPANVRMWALSYFHGYVRMPAAFAQLGWTWALSGQPGLAFAGFKKAMDLLPDGEKGSIKQRLADVYFMQNENDESEALYYELLVEDPENMQALLGSARIACRKGDFVKAGEFLDRAEKSGVNPVSMAFEKALLSLYEGNMTEARTVLEDLLERNPAHVRAWTVLADVCMGQGDKEGLKRCALKLKEINGGELISNMIEGKLALMDSDLDSARRIFRQALGRDPNNIYVLEQVLRLDVALRRENDARLHMLHLLRLDPGNALANFTRGSLQMLDGDYDMAEDSFRKSLEKQKTPHALNELAWLLAKRERYRESERLAREAIAQNDKMSSSWDTLGVVLMKTGRLDEAQKAFEKSLSINQSDPSVFLHMAEFHLMKGDNTQARELMVMLDGKRDELSSEDKKQLEKMFTELP